jgi:tRNA A-37 threonylcarbamoyl transferase component Bud32
MSAGPQIRAADPATGRLLAEAGIGTVRDLLERAEWVRRLRARSNLRLRLGARTVHVKHHPRARTASPEARGLRAAAAAGVPVPPLAFEGASARDGAVAGTFDLAPARPLDDLLREGLLGPELRRRVGALLARAVAALHGAGRHHRDLYLNHAYVDPEALRPLAGIVDWDRSGRHRRVWGRRVVKDLAALEASARAAGVPARERLRFAVTYVAVRGGLDRRRTRRRLRQVLRRAERIGARVPRTPVGEAARPRPGAAP